MAIRMEQAGLRDSFELHVTQAQMADALGLTSVHVNRVLQSLRRDGVIATLGREIRVLDWDRLCALSEFDRGYLEAGVAA